MKQGTPAHTALNALVNESISGKKNWDALTLSDETYEYYQTNDTMLLLELFYAPPVRIHSTYKFFSSLDNLIIPLDGRHSSTNAVFGRIRGVSTAGSMHIETTAPLIDHLENQGLCSLKP
jgi:hypothetical protein